MKKPWWISLFRFQKTERNGIIVLLPLVFLVLVVVKIFMGNRNAASPETSISGEATETAWNQYKGLQEKTLTENPETSISNQPLFAFDPNTVDSVSLLKLGFRPKTTYYLLNWRRKGKIFYKKEDLKKLYSLSATDYQLLEPYIIINSSNTTLSHQNSSIIREEPLPEFISINTADSALLVRLHGIGPALAHKITARRKLLGGFIKHEQLLEIYRFPDSTFNMLKEKLLIDISEVRKLKLNTASLEQLASHPYIGEKMAGNIILFREGMKRFENPEQLRQVPLMDEEKYRKLAPYFSLE